MGRGRAKAKQQKVARELKYSTHETDFTALQRELSSESTHLDRGPGGHEDSFADDDYDDEDSWAARPR